MSGTETLLIILFAALAAGTPLVFAALGELVVERSGVLNLGVEGMMSVGAVVAFITTVHSSSFLAGVLAGALAGVVLALVFGLLTITLLANQVASGLALTLFGTGLSAFFGLDYLSQTVDSPGAFFPAVLSDLPFIGRLLFGHDVLVYVSWGIFATIAWILSRGRLGLLIRAVGESPESATKIGYKVSAIRYASVAFGGAMAGIGGAYLSLIYTPAWAEGMVAGRGWIALALVVFATWRPARVLFGAYLFGAITIAQFHAQGFGIEVPSQFLSMLPYLVTIVVLVVISRDRNLLKLNAPAALGKPFHPEN